MPLEDLLTRARIVMRVPARDKWDVIRVLCAAALDDESCSHLELEGVVAAVTTRERSLSTGMERGIALPHAFVPGMSDSALVLGLAPHGIPFDALDGQPAKVIALLLAPSTADARQHHLTLLARLSGFFIAPGTLERLVGAADEASVREIVRLYLGQARGA